MGLSGPFCESRIVVFIGDNGAVVISIIKGIIANKYFIKSESDPKLDEVRSCIEANKGVAVYVVLDHSDQLYTRHVIPATSRLIARSIARKKSSMIVDEDAFSASLLVAGSDKPGEDWQFVLVEGQLRGGLSKCMFSMVTKSSNNFVGVLVFSLELAGIISCVASHYGRSHKWVVALMYTKVGDFRRVVFSSNEVVSSDTIQVTEDEKLPDIMAGKVHQEVQETIQNLGRQGVRGEEIGVYIVVPSSVKASLFVFNFGVVNVSTLTPYELGNVQGIQDCVEVSSMYCDTVVLYAVMRNKVKLLLHTRETLSRYRMCMLRNCVTLPVVAVSSLFLFLSVLLTLHAMSSIKKMHGLRVEADGLVKEWQKLRGDYEFVKIHEMYEIMGLYKSLSSVSACPLELAVRLSKLEMKDFEVNYFSWSIAENLRVVSRLRVQLKSGSYKSFEERFAKIFSDYDIKVSEISGEGMPKGALVVDMEGEQHA